MSLISRIENAILAGGRAAWMNWRGWRVGNWELPEHNSDYLVGASLKYDDGKGPSFTEDPGWMVSRFADTAFDRYKSFRSAVAVAEYWATHGRLP